MKADSLAGELSAGGEGAVEPISYELCKMRSGLSEKMLHPFVQLVFASIVAVGFSLAMKYAGLGGVLAVTAFVVTAAISYHRISQASSESKVDAERLFASVPFARLTVRGHRKDLAKVSPPGDVAFEPIIFERVYAGASQVRFLALGIFFGVVLMTIVERWTSIPRNSGALGAIYQVIGIMVLWFISRLFPSYYRITPGRLDIMRFAPLTNRVRKSELVNLRTSKIRVVLERATVIIRDNGNEHTIILRGISEPFKFIDALLLGAVSTHHPAPVPDDRLIG